MASHVRMRTLPQCLACLRSYAWAAFEESTPVTSSALRQQTRGKKKMPNNSATVTVRLNRDLKAFGKRGAYVPVERGRMRNQFFPQGIADYVPIAQLKTIKLSGVPIERDFTFGVAEDTTAQDEEAAPELIRLNSQLLDTSKQALKVERLTPERSVELLEIFVRPRLDFYRQPVREEKPADSEELVLPEEKQRSASSAAADLLAARTHAARARAKSEGPQAIFGSVSTHDVLTAIRAALATNDEAARVTFTEDSIEFVDLPAQGENEAGKIKHIGDFTAEIRIKGVDRSVRRNIRVIPQEP